MAIATSGLTAGYDGRAVIRDVSVQVASGEAVAILGPNGSGKSTLVNAIVGLAQHQGGTVELLGRPAGSLTDRWRVGYVPQSLPSPDVTITVAEFVAIGRLARLRPWQPMRRIDRAAIGRALDAVSLGGFERRQIDQLSGGERRRALIARALCAEPEVLLLDEPTAGVDAATSDALATSLARLHANGLTIVLVTHEIGPVEAIVERVIAMHNGAVAYDGPPRPADEVGAHAEDHQHHHGDEPPPGAAAPAWEPGPLGGVG